MRASKCWTLSLSQVVRLLINYNYLREKNLMGFSLGESLTELNSLIKFLIKVLIKVDQS